MTRPLLAAPVPTVLPIVEPVVLGVPVEVLVPPLPAAGVLLLPLVGAGVADPAAGLDVGAVVPGVPDPELVPVGVGVPAGPVPGVVPVGTPDGPEPAPVPVPVPVPVGVPVPVELPLPVGVAGPAGDVDPL
jgi:hypothetical protein